MLVVIILLGLSFPPMTEIIMSSFARACEFIMEYQTNMNGYSSQLEPFMFYVYDIPIREEMI